MPIAEWDGLSQIRSVARLTCRAHFSYLVENLMDMYHGTLHARYQVWTAQALREVCETEAQETATYDATTYYQVKGLASMLDLFLPPLRSRRRAALTVTYDYPHWRMPEAPRKLLTSRLQETRLKTRPPQAIHFLRQ